MDENTIRKEVTEELRKEFARPYTDEERLAAYENLLTKIQQILLQSPLVIRSESIRYIIDLIDEEMDK